MRSLLLYNGTTLDQEEQLILFQILVLIAWVLNEMSANDSLGFSFLKCTVKVQAVQKLISTLLLRMLGSESSRAFF